MPLYEFCCAKCGHSFEALLPAEKREAVACEICGEKAERVYRGQRTYAKKRGCQGSCAGCKGCGAKES